LEIEDLISDETKQKKELSTSRPIIFIAENMFSMGMKAFRNTALVFRIFKSHEIVYKKISEIVNYERLNLSNDIIAKICTTFNNHLGAILNFLDLIRKGSACSRTEVDSLLDRNSTQFNEVDYYGVLRILFDKSHRNRLFNSRIL
jgi:hypothetical protein